MLKDHFKHIGLSLRHLALALNLSRMVRDGWLGKQYNVTRKMTLCTLISEGVQVPQVSVVLQGHHQECHIKLTSS